MASLTQATIPTDAVQERATAITNMRYFSVKSATRAITHTVSLNTAFNHVSCSCESGRWGKKCWHKQAVQEFVADLAAKELEQTTEARMTAHGYEWNGSGWTKKRQPQERLQATPEQLARYEEKRAHNFEW